MIKDQQRNHATQGSGPGVTCRRLYWHIAEIGIEPVMRKEGDMGVPKPLLKDQADPSIRELFEGMHAAVGKMPNLFGVMARFPAALKCFVPFYNAVMLKGRLPAKLKELAYLKTASINVCQY
jgi:hypothetical protein